MLRKARVMIMNKLHRFRDIEREEKPVSPRLPVISLDLSAFSR